MNDQGTSVDAVGAHGKLAAKLAITGLASALGTSAGAEIVSYSDLNLVIEKNQAYSLPGLPYLDIYAQTRTFCNPNVQPKVCVSRTYGSFVGSSADGDVSKVPVSGTWVKLEIPFGALIGPTGIDPSDRALTVTGGGYDDAYVAVKFMEEEDTSYRYGWINFSLPEGDSDFVIRGYAYNDVAGASIRAGQTTDVPEPGTLALLAAGMFGAAAGYSRRRSRIAASSGL